ncbi:hypothetical protein [Acidiphilium sp. AL]|nr:hypothetical protein [Acidiphilium sp. AL]
MILAGGPLPTTLVLNGMTEAELEMQEVAFDADDLDPVGVPE